MALKGHKELQALGAKAAGGTPNDAQLEQINQHALTPMTPEQTYVRTFYLAHNAIDRDGEFFDDALLKDFAATLPGKGLFVRHPRGWDGDSGPPEGKWFAAKVVSMPFAEARKALGTPNLKWAPGVKEAQILEASAYMPRTSDNATLIAKVDAGVAKDVSIGYSATDRQKALDAEGNVVAMRLVGPGEGLEGSLVWLGAQPGAHAVKSANNGNEFLPEDHDMELKEELTQLKGEFKALQDKQPALEKDAAGFRAVIEAIGGDLAGNPGALKALVGEATQAKNALVEGVIKLERELKLCGDDETAVTAAKALYGAKSIADLKAWHDRLAKQSKGAGSTLEDSDPNGDGGTPTKPEGKKDYNNPLENAAIIG